MRIKKTNLSGRDKLYTTLDAYCKSINRRSVNYTIEPYSATFASITVQMTGKRATAQKKVVLYFDTEYKLWTAIVNGIEYYLVSLSEIVQILKQQINKLSGWVNKF